MAQGSGAILSCVPLFMSMHRPNTIYYTQQVVNPSFPQLPASLFLSSPSLASFQHAPITLSMLFSGPTAVLPSPAAQHPQPQAGGTSSSTSTSTSSSSSEAGIGTPLPWTWPMPTPMATPVPVPMLVPVPALLSRASPAPAAEAGVGVAAAVVAVARLVVGLGVLCGMGEQWVEGAVG